MSTKRKLWIIFLLALALRLLWIATLDNTVDVWGDWWDELGWRLAQGHGFWVKNPYFPGYPDFYSWRSPGFPFFLSLIYRVSGHSLLAAKFGLAIMSSATAVLLYFLAAQLIDRKTGLLAGLLYAVYAPAVFWTGYLAPDNLFVPLLLLTTLCLVYAERQGEWTGFFLAGIFLGMGVLSRSLFLVVLPVGFVWLLVRQRRLAVPGTLLVLAGCLLIAGPWTFRNYRIHHRFVLTSTEGGIVCYIANNPNSLSEPSGYWNPPPEVLEQFKGLSEVEFDRALYRQAFAYIRSHPAEYGKLVRGRFIRFWRFYLHTFSGPGQAYSRKQALLSFFVLTPIFLLTFYGFYLSLKKWRGFFLFYLLILGWSLPVILFFKTVIRYREALMPCLLIFAAHALLTLLQRINYNKTMGKAE